MHDPTGGPVLDHHETDPVEVGQPLDQARKAELQVGAVEPAGQVGEVNVAEPPGVGDRDLTGDRSGDRSESATSVLADPVTGEPPGEVGAQVLAGAGVEA